MASTRSGLAEPGLATTWRHPTIVVLIAIGFTAVMAFSAFEGTFTIFGRARIGFTQATGSAAFVIVGVLLSAVQLGLVGRVIPAFGEKRSLGLGYGLVAAGLAILAMTRGWPLLIVALALLCVGQGLAAPTITSTVVGRIDPSRRGAILGVQQSAASLGRVLGPALGGLAFDHIGVSAPFVVGALLVAGCAAACLSSLP